MPFRVCRWPAWNLFIFHFFHHLRRLFPSFLSFAAQSGSFVHWQTIRGYETWPLTTISSQHISVCLDSWRCVCVCVCAHVEEEVAGTRYYHIGWKCFKFQELSTCVCVMDVTLCVGLLPAISVCVCVVCVCVLCYSRGAVCLFACNLGSFKIAGGVSNKPERRSSQILMLWRLQYPFLLAKHTLRGACWNYSQHRRYKSKSLMQSRKKDQIKLKMNRLLSGATQNFNKGCWEDFVME